MSFPMKCAVTGMTAVKAASLVAGSSLTSAQHVTHETHVTYLVPHERVVTDVQRGVSRDKMFADLVRECLGLKPLCLRRAIVLVAVLIGPGDEGHIFASQLSPPISDIGVRDQVFERMAHVGRAVA